MSPSISRMDRYPSASAVEVSRDWLRVDLRDGRRLSVPVAWFPWLARANDTELTDFEIIEDGQGIWWNAIDEGVSVPGLLGLPHACHGHHPTTGPPVRTTCRHPIRTVLLPETQVPEPVEAGSGCSRVRGTPEAPPSCALGVTPCLSRGRRPDETVAGVGDVPGRLRPAGLPQGAGGRGFVMSPPVYRACVSESAIWRP